MRFLPFVVVVLLTAMFLALGGLVSPWWLIGAVICGPLALLGVYDLVQKPHSILRNYPLAAHFRFLFEMIRPEIHQYFIEDDTSGRPFNRDERSLIYERSKNIEGLKPFGTELDVYSDEYEWSPHSIAPCEKSSEYFRTMVGGPECKQPYSCSLLNVSSMSFGAISPNAILALNAGAKKGGFAHWTGEGGFSPYHRRPGGDVVWQIGTGYFGCRNDDGTFNADLFAEQAVDEQIKMIEIKISQGAKPGHGGVLPAAKITAEIAETRKVPMGQDCISPPGHSTFHTPKELCQWVQQLRDLCGGKPVGFKLCIGMPHEFLAICKAMLETGQLPDFINVDGGEGGTGAAPLEFSDSMGAPLVEGLVFVHNALVGCGLRDKIKIACAGKVSSAADIIRNVAIGADWCNVARGFMLSVGCIQAQACHTNACPVGVATQDPKRYRALDVAGKSERAYRFHKNTMETLAEMVAAMGLETPDGLKPLHVYKRISPTKVMSYEEAYDFLTDGELLDGKCGHPLIDMSWRRASAETFRAQG
ncbi:FMN-binding glutamate synthase family protein [Aeoliella sp.]|uniref:FMN-binding glutamate synthase family protein n=1 Tax=Aeoliella sp. TaxID=2795800 RepID=UPI003CCB775F